MLNFGVLTVSDSCSTDPLSDRSGPLLKATVLEQLPGSQCVHETIVPDDKEEIQKIMLLWSGGEAAIDLLLTTGGTGFTPRDVTPEATRAVLTKEAPGLAQLVLHESLKITKFAALSRAVCGVLFNTLVVNLPGSPKAVVECFGAIASVVPHAVDQLRGQRKRVASTHTDLQLAANHNRGNEMQKLPPQVCCDCTASATEDAAPLTPLTPVTSACDRPRQSPHPLVPFDEALERVMERSDRLGIECVRVKDAVGRILAAKIEATDQLPPWPASIKDGYAVRSCDGTVDRHVVGVSDAGSRMEFARLEAGECVRVSTGGRLPAGADAVIEVERTEVRHKEENREEKVIGISAANQNAPAIVPGLDVRPPGSDMEVGEIVAPMGMRVDSAVVGSLAAAGITAEVTVYRPPLVGVMSTGNEVQDAEEPRNEWCIRDSNRPALLTLLSENGFPTVDLGIVPDEKDDIERRIISAITVDKCDVIVSSGGVSMGEKDHIQSVCCGPHLRGSLHFGRVLMKPCKPTTFITVPLPLETRVAAVPSGDLQPPQPQRGRLLPYFALPGNPVSGWLAAQLFVLPALRQMAGWQRPHNTQLRVKLGEPMRLDARPEFRRCHIQWPTATETKAKGETEATETGETAEETTGLSAAGLPVASASGVGQQSSRLLSSAGANGVVRLPSSNQRPGAELSAGSVVDAILFAAL